MSTALVVLCAVQTIALVVVVGGFLRHLERRDDREQAERRELLTRIQHPQLVPLAPAPPRDAIEPEPDEIDLIGAVQ